MASRLRFEDRRGTEAIGGRKLQLIQSFHADRFAADLFNSDPMPCCDKSAEGTDLAFRRLGI
jgi:hypothetical protein